MKWYTKYMEVYEKPFADAPQDIIDEGKGIIKQNPGY